MAAVSGLRSRLVLTTAVVAIIGGYSRRAYADCNPTGGGNYLCSGTTTTLQQITAPGITVTTDGTFSANVSTDTAVSVTGTGDISFKDFNRSTITSTFTGGAGLLINGSAGVGSVTVYTSGVVTGDQSGIGANNFTNGAMTITTTGDVVGSNAANGIGINAHNDIAATDLTVTAKAGAQGGAVGIQTQNFGLGATVIKTYGAVTGTSASSYGINAFNGSTTATDLTITSFSSSVVTGGTTGIGAINSGSGALTITSVGPVTGTNGKGINARNYGTNLTITASNTQGGANGIDATNFGSGALTITSTGTAKATAPYTAGTGVAIYARNNGTNLSITAADTYGTAYGMRANNRGSGALTITSTGHATGVGEAGIFARNYYGTSLTVNAVDSSGRVDGIFAFNDGSGALTITSTGTASGYAGIDAFNSGTRLTITAANTNGGFFGIYASNSGSGALTITSTGTASGTAGIGISALNSGTSLNIVAADVSGAYAGIRALNRGSGNLSITSTGAVTASNGTGVQAVDYGPGAISVTAGGKVTGLAGDGIYTNAAGTGSTTIAVLSTALLQGKVEGVKAVARGGQPISITNQGTIQNLTGLSSDLAITTVAGSTAIVNSGLVQGTVILGNQGGNTFDNQNGGIWSTAGGTNEFDPGPNSITNEAGGVIVAANAGATAPVTTTFNGLATFTNAGTITMQNGVAGDRTVVTGNFIGQGGTVVLDTFLGSDGSASDQLVLNGGTASGTTALRIVNAGGPGALTTADGIKVVDAINGATTDPTAFHLTAAVAAGAYDYGLFYGGIGADANDQDWYLRSIVRPNGPGSGPALNPSAQTTLPYADILSNYAFATLGTLQQRTGNRIWPNGPPETIWCKDPAQNYRCTVNAEQASIYANGGPVIYGAGAWGRIAGQYASYDPSRGASYTQSLGFLQAGYEGVAYEAGPGDLTVGGYATVGTSRADIDVTPDPVTGAARPKGHITTTGYGVGVNTTWLGNDGLYADGIGQFTFYQSDLSNKVGGNNQGWSSALSLEAGKRFELGSGWAVVPQAQLAWTHVDFSSFTDENGSRVAIGKGDSLKGRAGVRVEKLDSWKVSDGQVRRLQLYGIANLSYEFLDGTSVKLNGTEIEQQNKRLWGEVGLGGTYAWNDKWSVYAEADYATALASHAGNDNYILKGTAGLRYRW